MADEDACFEDFELLAALDQLEKKHGAARTDQSAGSKEAAAAAAAAAPPQQQPPAPPPAANSSRQPLHDVPMQQQHQARAQPRQQWQPQQQQQHNMQPGGADMNQIWGLFCSGPPPAPNSTATKWANKQLQRRGGHNSSSNKSSSSGSRTHAQHAQPWQQQPQQQLGPGAPQQPGMPYQQGSWHPPGPGQQQQQHPYPQQQQHVWQQQQQQQHQGGAHSLHPQPPAYQQQRQQWQQDLHHQQQQQHQQHIAQPPHQQHMQQSHQQQQQQQQQGPASAAVSTAAGAVAQGASSSMQAHAAAPAPYAALQCAGPGAAPVQGNSLGPAVSCTAAAVGAGSGGPAAAGACAGGVSGGVAVGAGGASGGPAAGSGGPAGAAGSGGPVTYTAKLALGKNRQIEVVFSGWHTQLAAVVSSVPGCRRADDNNAWGRTWLVPVDKVGALQQALDANLPPNVRLGKIDPLPDLVRNVLAAADKRPDDSAMYATLKTLFLEPGVSLADRMRPFQREGVQFGLRAGGRVLIGDEMGLGKTVQACALAKCYQAEWPVLVVTPSSLRLSWAAALYQWLRVTEDRVLVTLKRQDMVPLSQAASERDAQAMYDFVIVSYDMLKDVAQVLEAIKFKVVILDESHCIKSPQAQRTKFAKPLVEKASRAILLSGTPALSNPAELLTQLQALLPRARITKAGFEERYMDVRHYGKFSKAVGGKNGEELNRLLTSTVMIRRKKAEVLKDLPAKCRNQVPLLLDAAQRKQLDTLKSTLNEVRQLSSNIDGVGAEVGGGLLAGMEQEQRNMVMALWHKTAGIKAKAVADYVKELLANSDTDDKFLVFAYHRELMDAIEKGVNEMRDKKGGGGGANKDLRYMRIDGSTPAQQRQSYVNAFQEDEHCRVAILNIKAAGVGLTLTRASTVVFAELAWTPSEVQQAEDRAHRIGQTQCVNVHLLLVKDSIDDLMWELLQNKLATTGQVLDGEATRMEVQRSSTQQPKGKGAGSGGGRPRAGGGGAAAGAESQQQQSQQPSITNFFASSSGGGGGGGPAAKKQRSA